VDLQGAYIAVAVAQAGGWQPRWMPPPVCSVGGRANPVGKQLGVLLSAAFLYTLMEMEIGQQEVVVYA
jgi:hypothetical protein